MAEHLTVLIAIIAIALASYSIFARTRGPPGAAANLPWVGLKEGWFAKWTARVRAFRSGNVLLQNGYRKYSKNSLPFILPLLYHYEVMIPPPSITWIIDQPDDVLSAREMQKASLQTDYTLLDPDVANKPLHEVAIRRDLTRNLGGLIPDIMEELSVAVDKFWGLDTEAWREVCPVQDCKNIVSRASNRMFVGLPLCRNEDYLSNAAAFATDVPVSSFFIRLMLPFLRPLFAWIPLISNRLHFARCAKYLLPLITQRIADIDAKKDVPNDFTTWYIKSLSEQDQLHERNPVKIALRLMAVNFAAIHTSTFAATNILFDIFSSASATSFIEGIREEVETLLKESDGVWDKSVVSRMIKTDSAVRESLRISTFMSRGMSRVVVDPKGATLSDRTFLPVGTRIGTPVWAIHHDEGFYENANTYDAFRFSRAREDALSSTSSTESSIPAATNGLVEDPRANGQTQSTAQAPSNPSPKDLTKLLESKNLSTVTTSDTFLSFGHGRHACPGRFFAATEMKLLLAYIAMNYDVKPMEERPPNKFLGGNVLPPMKATIWVRRRS